MAIKRTKKQKLKSEQRRVEALSYSLNDLGKQAPKNEGSSSALKYKLEKPKKQQSPLFDSEFIKRDLLATVVVSVVVFAVLIAYTIYYR